MHSDLFPHIVWFPKPSVTAQHCGWCGQECPLKDSDGTSRAWGTFCVQDTAASLCSGCGYPCSGLDQAYPAPHGLAGANSSRAERAPSPCQQQLPGSGVSGDSGLKSIKSQTRGIRSWRSVLHRATVQGPAGLVTVPVAASSIPGAPPAIGRAAQGKPSQDRHSASTKTWGFYFSPLRPDLRLELLWKLRPGCAPQTPIPAGDPMGLPALPAQQAALRNIPARSRQIFLSSDWCH